jgi:hypothetical protein
VVQWAVYIAGLGVTTPVSLGAGSGRASSRLHRLSAERTRVLTNLIVPALILSVTGE